MGAVGRRARSEAVDVVTRPSRPKIVRALLLLAAVVVVLHAELRGASQGERITEIQHTLRVELCSTTASCQHLLDELIAAVGPSEIRRLHSRFSPHRLPAAARRLAPQIAQRHRAVAPRTRTRARAPGRRPHRPPAPSAKPKAKPAPLTIAPSLVAPAASAPPPSSSPGPPPVPPTPPPPEPPGRGLPKVCLKLPDLKVCA